MQRRNAIATEPNLATPHRRDPLAGTTWEAAIDLSSDDDEDAGTSTRAPKQSSPKRKREDSVGAPSESLFDKLSAIANTCTHLRQGGRGSLSSATSAVLDRIQKGRIADEFIGKCHGLAEIYSIEKHDWCLACKGTKPTRAKCVAAGAHIDALPCVRVMSHGHCSFFIRIEIRLIRTTFSDHEELFLDLKPGMVHDFDTCEKYDSA